jgi:glycosyltransferase involved in cell wall biosynthesis
MKVLLLHTLYVPHIGGGAEIIVRQLAEGLARRGCEVSVLVTGPEQGLHCEQGAGLRLYRAGLHNLYWHFTQQRPNRLARLRWHWRDRYNREMRQHVRAVIEREQPDIVLCNNLTGWSVSAWDEISAAGLPIVQVLHDLYLLCPKDTMFNKGHSCERQCPMCALLRRNHAQASRQVRAVIGVSRFMLDRLVGHGYFSGASRHVVLNACALPAPAEPAPQVAAKRPLRFGYIGTLSANKGVGWLIEQFQALSMDATLTIAGRGKLDYEAELRSLADPGRVRFTGYQDTQAFMATIDVLVVPSRWAEPFGLVAVEGCANHLPVIATEMGGLPEIIRDGVNGLLCSPADEDSLGRAMLQLYRDRALRERLAQQARNSVLPLLDMERMLDDYLSVLRKTHEGGRAQHEHATADYPVAPAQPAGD